MGIWKHFEKTSCAVTGVAAGITLFDFKTLDENLGENLIGSTLEHIDPLVAHYDAALNRLGDQEFFRQTVEQLFEAHPFDESRPPYALGVRVTK